MKKSLKYFVPIVFLACAFIIRPVWNAMDKFVVFEVLEQLESRSGDHVSVLYTSDGGATTTTAIFVAVLPSDDEDYRDDEYRVLTLNHTYDVSMSWNDERSLQIRLPSNIEESEFRVQKTEVSGVTISYLEQDQRLEGIEVR